MADLAPVVGGLVEVVGPLIGPVVKRALGAFFKTTAGMVALGLVGLGVSWAIAWQGVWWKGLLAGVVSLALFAGLGVFLAMKRAVGSAVVRLLSEARLGNKIVGALFARVLKVDEAEAMGERGIRAAREVERVPLAQAELQLRAAAAKLGVPDDATGLTAWMRRQVEGALIERIEALTLARFRDMSVTEGGVDLIRVRDELAGKVDGLVRDQVEGALGRVTMLVVGGATLGSVAVAMLVRQHL